MKLKLQEATTGDVGILFSAIMLSPPEGHIWWKFYMYLPSKIKNKSCENLVFLRRTYLDAQIIPHNKQTI